ncbi:hypothetical protein G785_03097 [Escherichia coli HVH 125 (4-2634716)]|nr:hypothetical protein G785_03097 [Escherichia coli HVH 125 (4-2634716)]
MPVTQHAQKSPSQQPLSENHLFTGLWVSVQQEPY